MLPNMRNLQPRARAAVMIAALFAAFGLMGLCTLSGAQTNPLILAGVVLVGAAVQAALMGGILWLTRRGASVEKVFLLLYIPLSLLMMAAMPIFRAPDEPAHLQRIYQLSTGQFVPVSGWYVQPENLMAGNVAAWMHLSDVRAIFGSSLSRYFVAVEPNEATAVYPVIAYLPQTLLMSLAHLFTENRGVLFYAARLGGWLATTAMFYGAIRLTPRGKNIMLVVTLLPMALQEAASASADGMAVGCVMLLVALVLRVREDGRLFPGTRRLMCLTAVGLVSFKVLYAPFMLLMLLLPREAFPSVKKRRMAWAYACVCALMTLGLWAWVGLYPGAMGGSHSGQVMDQLLAALCAPHAFIWLMIKTIVRYVLTWGWQMFGGSLGWLNIPVHPLVIVPLAGLLIYVTCHERPVSSPRQVRIAFWGLTLLSAFIIITSLYLWWTGAGSAVIEGVQGRYFLPFATPVMIGMCGLGRRSGETRAPVSGGTYALAAFLSVCSLVNVLAHTLL